MAGQISDVTDSNFQAEVLESDTPVLVDFWAPWCGPCRQLGPTIDRLADQFGGRLKVGKLNTDHSSRIAGGFGIRGIPTTIVFDHGKEVARQSGALPSLRSRPSPGSAQRVPSANLD